MPRFSQGDRCIVTGDEGDWHHHFSAGTEVTLDEWDNHYNAWNCEPVEPYAYTEWDGTRSVLVGQMVDDSWWVREPDLRLIADTEPDEDEIKRLFGIEPTPHCTTCICHTKS